MVKIKRINFSLTVYCDENIAEKKEMSAIFNENVISVSKVQKLIYSEQYASNPNIIVTDKLRADILFGKQDCCTASLIKVY